MSIEMTKRDFEQQKLENKFFQLLKTHSQILNEITKYQATGGTNLLLRGTHVFELLYRDLVERYKTRTAESKTKCPIKLIKLAYKPFFQTYQLEIGHYFRHLYHIIKFIDQGNLDDKQSYVNLVQAQLSGHESLLIFYNCLSKYGSKRFKPLIEKYALFENMPDRTIDKILNLDHSHYSLYKPGAYQEANY